jgi:hypothetical protein
MFSPTGLLNQSRGHGHLASANPMTLVFLRLPVQMSLQESLAQQPVTFARWVFLPTVRLSQNLTASIRPYFFSSSQVVVFTVVAVSGLTAPFPCSVGRFNPLANQSSCIPCLLGQQVRFFCFLAGRIFPASRHNPGRSPLIYVLFVFGSPLSFTHPPTHSHSRLQCPLSGMTRGQPCVGAGRYSPSPGHVNCLVTPAGYYVSANTSVYHNTSSVLFLSAFGGAAAWVDP